MPATNSIKVYSADSFYHLYNRGVEKRNIFLDEQDFTVFLSYLKTYLLPKDLTLLNSIISSSQSSPKDKSQALRLLKLNNFSEEIELHAFALLPNHFHLLVKQSAENSIDRFLNSLGTRYTQYFNSKYKRVGSLYQGVYKGVLVETDEQLLHLSRYIHLNPFVWLNEPVRNFQKIQLPSSLENYLGNRTFPWLKTDQILSYFNKIDSHSSYYKFLEDYGDPELVAPLALDYTDDL